MLPMKRVRFILFSILVLAALTASSGSALAIVAPDPGGAAPGTAPAPAAAPAPGGDLAKGNGDPVCIALPIKSSGQSQGKCNKGQVALSNSEANGGAIIEYLKAFLFVLNILVGGIIVLVIVLAGVQYITSAADPARVKSAKGRIQGAIIALILYLMMTAILNFLVPGGVF